MKKKLFIDCGAHCGESILEAKKRFGENTKIVSFEANKDLSTKLSEYFQDDPNVTIQNKIVWINNNYTKFYLSTAFSDGSSIYREKISGGISKNVYQEVQCIDIIKYIDDIDQSKWDIILKLDVEGAEYEILNQMIKKGLMSKISEFYGEFHPTKINKQEVKDLIPGVMNWFKQNKVTFYSWELVGNSPKVIDRNIWIETYKIPKITFVIPSRNNLEFLQVAYKSIRNLKTKHEVLVLNDASTDGTLEWLKNQKDKDLITYHNPGPERIGIVGMFDKGIEMARTDIIFAFHADMIASPNLDINIVKHLKPQTIVSATRVEPSLHPPGPEKITKDWGIEVEDIDFKEILNSLEQQEESNKGKTTEGIFAPWCMHKEDFLAIGGHDELFAPQSKEDSDLFNRFILNNYKVIQSWDALVYHFTSRGSRFNKHSGGAAGKNSNEWIQTTTKNGRNFIRKWGHFVMHDSLMKPIIPPKYDIGIKIKGGTSNLLELLEPWCSNILLDDEMQVITTHYLDKEQKNTAFDLSKKIKSTPFQSLDNDIIVEIDQSTFSNEDFQIIQQLSQIVKQSGEIGKFEIGNLFITIDKLEEYQNSLIKI